MTGNKRIIRVVTTIVFVALMGLLLSLPASAAIEPVLPDSPIATAPDAGGGAGSTDPNISIDINGESSDAVKVVLLLTILTVLPSLLIMMTSFTRIIIVFSLLRNALGLQQTPPNQVLIGLALFLSLFIMQPIITEINETAYQPFSEGTIESDEFLDRAKVPLRAFMVKQTKNEDLSLFLNLAGKDRPETIEEYTMDVVIPAFITSEVKRAFTFGFLLFIPFLIIDMVVASALMSMGMMMLPPVTVSLPFKLMLFVLVDGWGLLIRTLVSTYNM